MLEAAPKGFFSHDFRLLSPAGELAELDVSAWRERAEFELDGQVYRMYREGLVSGAFVLERDGQVVARAAKPSVFRDRFEIEVGNGTFTLRKPSLLSRRFVVHTGDQPVGSIARAGLFTRRTLIDLPPDWPLALQLFVFWLALVIWKRERAAASH